MSQPPTSISLNPAGYAVLVAAKKPRQRWWQCHPGRFDPQIEDALASGVPTAVGLAWAIILALGGAKGENTMARFAKRIGCKQNAITQGLQGKSFGPKQQARVYAAFPDRDLPDTLFVNRHPFHLGSGFENPDVMEPGDADWDSFWNILVGRNGSSPTAVELQEKHPNAFP